MLPRNRYLHGLQAAPRRSPIVAILGPRQVAKATLARRFSAGRDAA